MTNHNIDHVYGDVIKDKAAKLDTIGKDAVTAAEGTYADLVGFAEKYYDDEDGLLGLFAAKINVTCGLEGDDAAHISEATQMRPVKLDDKGNVDVSKSGCVRDAVVWVTHEDCTGPSNRTLVTIPLSDAELFHAQGSRCKAGSAIVFVHGDADERARRVSGAVRTLSGFVPLERFLVKLGRDGKLVSLLDFWRENGPARQAA